ncbi:hypothetical protein NC796_04815 [Aliifodinibius sp. S!AR15-10]|uniref:ankyrin repeat domain-containing protein n=1 Tax=Aliifodinibius sp. S!AR15-10 TaxID=2950437 RepID=UPI002864C0EB|nr:ankyrin repeat domain-containing protein [Aliifodinibius sp. S!AR15-10]MDR8390452.1 hypothetical protein [Aliifodinibius sp. S!AR15-10]
MPSKSLPSRPSLDHLKHQAKDLLKGWKAGKPESLARIREFHPEFSDKSEYEARHTRFLLSDAQLVIAREYGFKSWSKLKTHIKQPGSQNQAWYRTIYKRLKSLGVRMIAIPVLKDFRQAFESRDASAVRKLLQQHPIMRRIIDEPLFPFASPALVYFAGQNDLALVEVLLEFGADPNRRSDWWAGGWHALHSAEGTVAEHLLEAGAEPDACAAAHLDRPDLLRDMLDEDPSRIHERGGDGQTPLHFARSRDVVDLLLDWGADPNIRDLDHRSTPAQWMLKAKRGAGRYELAAYLVERGASIDIFLAAALGLTERLRELLQDAPTLLELRTGRGEYGEKPPISFHIYTWTIGQHLSPLQVAAQFEQHEAFEVLQTFANPKDHFLAACAQGDESEAKQLLSEHPGLFDELTKEDRRALPDAGWAANAAAVGLMLELGFEPTTPGQDGGTVLHCAAWMGDAQSVRIALRYPEVRALVNQPDSTHDSTPIGWCCHGACHNGNPEGDYPAVARLLLEAGAKPESNLEGVPEDVLFVIREYEENRRNP